MECILCQLFPLETAGMPEFPEPVASRYQAPGNRIPRQHTKAPCIPQGTPSAGIRMYERPVTMTSDVAPTDLVNPFPRTQAEGRFIRYVPVKYVQVGGPAMTAPNQPGWSSIDSPFTPGERLLANHNSYYTIADTMTKPAQQYPQYNYASIDTEDIVKRAKNSVMRALYGGGK
jgi:hypothetical protein